MRVARSTSSLSGAETASVIAAAAQRASDATVLLAPHCRHCDVWEISDDHGARWQYLAAGGCCTHNELVQRLQMVFVHGVGLAPCESWLTDDNPVHPPLLGRSVLSKPDTRRDSADPAPDPGKPAPRVEIPEHSKILRMARPDGTTEAVLPFTVVVIQPSDGILTATVGHVEDRDGDLRVRALGMAPEPAAAALVASLIDAETATGDGPVPVPSRDLCDRLLSVSTAVATSELSEQHTRYPLRITPFGVAESGGCWHLGQLAPAQWIEHPDSTNTSSASDPVWHNLGPANGDTPLPGLLEATCAMLSHIVATELDPADIDDPVDAPELESFGPALDVAHAVATLFRDHLDIATTLATAGTEPLPDHDGILAELSAAARNRFGAGPVTADLIVDQTAAALSDMANIFTDADDEFLTADTRLLANNIAKLRVTGRVSGRDDPTEVLAAACAASAAHVTARAALWQLHSAAFHLADTLTDAPAGPVHIPGFETAYACIAAVDDTGDDPTAGNRRREARYLMRLLRKAQTHPDDRYTFQDPQRVARLARKVARLSDPAARRDVYVDVRSLAVLSITRGWRQHSPVCWTLGTNPDLPRLAVTAATDDDTATVTVLPPRDPAPTWPADIDNFETVMQEHGLRPSRVALSAYCDCRTGDPAEVCAVCGRPAGSAVDRPATLRAVCEPPAAAATAAVEMSPAFRLWLHAHSPA